MSDQPSQNQTSSDEVDLSLIFDKIKSFFKTVLLGVVMIFRFFWNHKIQLIILLIVGVALQFLLETNSKKIYANEFLVRTNFSSAEYLYGKVESLNNKLDSNDSLYLKNVFGGDFKRIIKVKVTPVVDVYRLVSKSPENKEIFKLLYDEFGDISFLEEQINVNQYPTHKIGIFVEGESNNEFISNNLYNFLSDNSHYNELKDIALESYREQLEANKIIKSQIDSILKDHQENNILPKFDNNVVNFKGSQDLNELLTQKRSLLNDNFSLKTLLVNDKVVFKIIDSSFAIYSSEQNDKNPIYSFLLFLMYCGFFLLKFLSRKLINFVEN
jgi:hypothetical protein